MASSRWFAMVPGEVVNSGDIGDGAKVVYMVMAEHASPQKRCTLSIPTIALAAKKSTRQVQREIRMLVANGFVKIEKGAKWHLAPTYFLPLHPSKAARPQPSRGDTSVTSDPPDSPCPDPQTGVTKRVERGDTDGTPEASRGDTDGTPESVRGDKTGRSGVTKRVVSKTQLLLSEHTNEHRRKKEKNNTENPPPPLPTKKPAAKGIPNEELFDRAWELAREVNRATAGRCCRKTSLARWTAKCRDLDAARACLSCWELEVNSRRTDSGLAFQRGFQVFLNAESWTDPHALDDLRAANENTRKNENEHTNGNGNGTRRKTQAERYHESMAEERRERGARDPESYRIEGLDDDFEEFTRRNEFKGRTFDS